MATPKPNQSQPFTRLNAPPQYPELQPIITDIYDKLNQIAALVNKLSSQ